MACLFHILVYIFQFSVLSIVDRLSEVIYFIIFIQIFSTIGITIKNQFGACVVNRTPLSISCYSLESRKFEMVERSLMFNGCWERESLYSEKENVEVLNHTFTNLYIYSCPFCSIEVFTQYEIYTL